MKGLAGVLVVVALVVVGVGVLLVTGQVPS